MRRKWKYTGRVIAFFLIFGILTVYLSKIVEPKDNLEQYGMQNVSANGILSERKNSIDALFLGDSLAYSSISPMLMYERQGFTSYVCSTPAQPLYYTKNLLERTLKDQSPKVVVLEADAIFRDFMTVDPLVQEFKDWFPLFEYHDRWKNLQIQDWIGDVHYTYNNTLKGFRLDKTVQPVKGDTDYMDKKRKGEEISMVNRWILDSIVEMCKEKDCQLFFYSAPSYKNWNWKRHDAVQAYCEKKNIPYLDMNTSEHSVSIDWAKDTRDKGDHLNYTGAQKVTEYIENYLKNHCDLPDHRQDADYKSWADSLANYKKNVEGRK